MNKPRQFQAYGTVLETDLDLSDYHVAINEINDTALLLRRVTLNMSQCVRAQKLA